MPRKAAGSTSQDSSETWDEFLLAIVARWAGDSGERKQDRSRRREQEILRASLRVFARDGISRSRIGDIASEAGMPVSTIYEYYPGKEELAYAVPLAHFGRFYAEFAEAVAEKRNWRDRLRLYLWLAVDFARRNPEWSRTLYLEIWPSVLVNETAVKEAINDYARIVVHLIKAGAEAGEWSSDANPYETAAILNGAVNQTIITWLLFYQPQDLMKAANSIIDRTMVLLSPTEQAAQPRRRGKLPAEPDLA